MLKVWRRANKPQKFDEEKKIIEFAQKVTIPSVPISNIQLKLLT